MNSTIETLLNHRSIRKFTDEKLTKEQIETIVRCARQASSSSNVMAYTIIGVSDEEKKDQLYQVSGHTHVKNNGHLFIFCADLYRHRHIIDPENEDAIANLESTEQFIVAVVDAALAAQNAAIAAESMGLGICYLGSLRNDIQAFNDILELPEYVVPLFGLAVGYPAHEPEIKPRLPLEAIYHENKYKRFDEQAPYIEQYDQQMKAYYEQRSTNKKSDTWTEQIARKFSKPTRMDVTPFVKSKRLNRK